MKAVPFFDVRTLMRNKYSCIKRRTNELWSKVMLGCIGNH